MPIKIYDKNVHPQTAYKLALLGATDSQIADVFNINMSTLQEWKQRYPEFFEELQKGKTAADAKVAEALFNRAVGYTCKAHHIAIYKGEAIVTEYDKHYPPDSWAAAKWLALRQKESWSETQRIETTQTNININQFDFTGMSTDELEVLKKIGMKQLEQQTNGRRN